MNNNFEFHLRTTDVQIFDDVQHIPYLFVVYTFKYLYAHAIIWFEDISLSENVKIFDHDICSTYTFNTRIRRGKKNILCLNSLIVGKTFSLSILFLKLFIIYEKNNWLSTANK